MHRLVLFEAVAGAIALVGGVTAAVAGSSSRRSGAAPDPGAVFHHVIVADSAADRPAAVSLGKYLTGEVHWFDSEDAAAEAPVPRTHRGSRRPWPARHPVRPRSGRSASAPRR